MRGGRGKDRMSDERRQEGGHGSDFRVGEWVVAPRGNRLDGPEGTERLEPKVMQVLECLAESPGRTVTKEEFMERVWAGTIVSDDVLSRCISELRKVFGDNPRRPHYIETVRKSGYRLIAPVTPLGHAAPGEREEQEADEAGSPEELVLAPALAAGPVTTAVMEDEEAVLVEEDFGPTPSGARSEPSGLALPVPSALPAAPAVVTRPPASLSRRRATLQWVVGVMVVALVALVLGVVAFGGDEAEPLKTVPFTSFPGQEAEPALSPDGERLAFTWGGPEGANVDIYVKQEGAETPLRLTDHPAREYSPAWSADGREIAFVRATEPAVREVVIVPAIGGSERTVARFEEREATALAWSPDGETLAVSVQAEPNGPFVLSLLSVETLQARRLTEPPPVHRGDSDPAFSPNGERLAFVRSAGEGVADLYVVSVRGGEPERLTRDEREIAGVDWTPDGRSLVFASDRAEGAGLWRIAAAGGVPQRITTVGEGKSIGQPTLARRGRRLAYEQRSSDANIWAIRSGRFEREPLVHSTRWESHPQFAGDGRQIAFASDRSGSPEVWLSNADGTNPIQLTSFGGAAVYTPRWSPDGRRLAFGARTEAGADIYLVDVGGGQPRRLTDDPADDLVPSWSQDSTTVYFSSNRSGQWEVWQVDAEGGAASRVTYRGGYNAFESLDGRHLYYAKKGEPGLWRYGVEDESETLVLGALESFDWGNWALTEGGIYFIRRAAAGPTIRYYNFLTGRSSPIVTLGEVPEQPSLAVSPDGRVLLYTHVDRNESDILLVENFR